MQVEYEGSFGYCSGETIGHDKNPNKNQMDEIFGMGGDDIIVAGAAIDKLKGGEGNDTIWGGSNDGARHGEFTGDTTVFWI